MNFDIYLDKIYNKVTYNCAHFVCDVWKELCKEDISEILEGVLHGPRSRKVDAHSLNIFERLKMPSSPCLALFHGRSFQAHVGIFFNGKILHITDNGVEWTYAETIMINFNKVRFYRVKDNNNS